MTTSSSSWTLIVSMVDVSFCVDITAFVDLLLVVLGKNQTVLLPIAEFLVVPIFGVMVGLVAIGFCRIF